MDELREAMRALGDHEEAEEARRRSSSSDLGGQDAPLSDIT